MDTLNNIKDSMNNIAEFLEQLGFYLSHPLDGLRDFLTVSMPFVNFTALVICAIALLMAIVGNKAALKWVPSTLMVYIIMKVMVSIL